MLACECRLVVMPGGRHANQDYREENAGNNNHHSYRACTLGCSSSVIIRTAGRPIRKSLRAFAARREWAS